MTANNESITLKLTSAQALVLFEWLTKQDELGAFQFAHESEERVMWNLQGQLEKQLTEPFAEDYAAKLAAARETVASE